MADTNLYPPVIETSMPTFIRTGTCKVYFSLSKYNSLSDIANAQVTVRYQNTNSSALSSSLYPSGIKITTVYEDDDITDDAKYYIEIDAADLTEGEFATNQYYKVQIRFTSTEAASVSGSIGIASWLTNNQDYFSEWSTVCLIKGINQPYFSWTSINSGIFTTQTINFVGSMYFSSSTEKEYLVSYDIQVYDTSSTLMADSGIQYTDETNPNVINYTFKYLFSAGSYTVVFNYTTNGGYTNSVSYSITVTLSYSDAPSVTISITPDEENGRNIITVTGALSGTVYLKRASSDDDYLLWDTIDTKTVSSVSSIIYYDYTIESGLWYEYGIQTLSGSTYSAMTISDKMINVLDDMFLTRADMQLRVRFDPGISSFKRTYSEALTETIGSQYPYIRRNGAINYRQFPISGLITGFCDGEGIFINEDTLYGDNASDYAYYNEVMQIKKSNDFIYERKFREKIMDFLYANDVKLFRSTTEGNILVRLMDISFTPKQELGRMIYDFSATAYEIDDCTVENYQNYGIL